MPGFDTAAKNSTNKSPIAFSALRKVGFLATAVAVGLTGILFAQEDKRDVPSPPTPITDPAVQNPVPEVLGSEPGEVLTRGPIHEAFAKPVVEDTKEPPIVPKTPPALIEELPPDERPVGENVLWVPGYYAWDEDRLDFIWISGVYRDAPPGHTWVAGYWRSVPGGSQWVPGFWTTVELQAANKIETEVEFLPEPPVTLEQGPSIPQPSENHFWIPGNWRYVNNKYAWQAGYWSTAQAGWIWVPAHYNWTPLGYVYVPGYWDYSLAQRGLVFAPVYFDAAYYANPVIYRPQVVLRSNFLTVHLWSRPRYCHYYFGDYYGNNYATVGYRPWFTPLVANRAYYDPLFTYYSWQGRRLDPRWNNYVQQRYEYVVNHANARPPRTYREQYRLAQQPQIQQYVNNVNIVNTSNTVIDINNTTINNNQRRPRSDAFGTADDVASLQIQNVAMTANLAKVATQQKQLPQAALQLEKNTPETKDRFAKQGRQFREIAAQREQLAGPRMPGVTTETVAPSTSGNPTTKNVTGDARTKVGGGKIRLPVVQPVADVAAAGRTTLPAVGGDVPGAEAVVPDITGVAPANPKVAFPGINKGANTPAGKSARNTDTDIPTERNPNKLGKNVPPAPGPTGIGSGVVGGGVDTGVAPVDVLIPGSSVNPTIPTPGQANTNPTNTTPNETNPIAGAPNNNPNTTANTVPGQRTPENGAFGQDRGPLVPPGQLAPGEQNPDVFNPRIADPNAPVGSKNAPTFNPQVADPTKSTNPSSTTTTPNGATTGTNNNPNTTANTVPGQRTPTNGAFGQDRRPPVPPGKLAPGQKNPEVFNPRVADPNAPAGSKNAPSFNPRVGDPTKSTNAPNSSTTPGNTLPNTTNNIPNTTTNTVPGQRTPTNGAFGQDRGALVPPGKMAPGQRNPEFFNPRIADPNAPAGSKNAPTFNPRVAPPKAGSNPLMSPPNTKSGVAPSNPTIVPKSANPAIPPSTNSRPIRGNTPNQTPALRASPAPPPANIPSVVPNRSNPVPSPTVQPIQNRGKGGGNPAGIQSDKQRGPANQSVPPSSPNRGKKPKDEEKPKRDK